MAITFRLPSRMVKIDDHALARLLAYRQLQPEDAEAGGVLLGRRLAGGHVVVDEITEPIPTDVRSRFAFHRSAEHQAEIDAAHERSGGTCNWLGEWHTHAEPDPRPSEVDLADWQRRAREDTYDAEELIFVIVGTEHTRAWTCDRLGTVAPLL
jgi:integrative and conjugative element protein (TIGR02256 family)